MRPRAQKGSGARLAQAYTAPGRWEHVLGPGETLWHTARLDLDRSGRYAEGWLLLTDRRLILVEGERPVEEVARSEIVGASLADGVGNGTVQVRLHDRAVIMGRYTRSCAGDVEALVARLGAETGKPDDYVHGRAGPRGRGRPGRDRCPECGRAFRGSVCPHCIDKRAHFRRLLRYVRPYVPHLAVSLVLMLVGTFLQVLPPRLTGILVDEVLLVRDAIRLRNLVIVLALVHIGASVAGSLRAYLMGWIGQSVVRDLRRQLFEHLQSLGMDFYDNVRTGSVMSRATNDTERLQRFVVQSTQGLISQVVSMAAIGVMLFRMNWKLALITLIPIPLIFIGTKVFSARMRRVYRRISVRRALMNSALADSIGGIRIVKTFGQEGREVAKFNRRNQQVFEGNMGATTARTVFNPFLSFATMLGTLLIWGYGGSLVIGEGSLTVGELVSFLTYLGQFYGPIRQLSGFADVVQEAATASERVFEILDTEPEPRPKSGVDRSIEVVTSPKLTFTGEIAFHDVHFAYQASEPVLRGITTRIRAGEMVGLVGPSGSGKSTLVSLIPRLYDVTAGKITLDGHDIRTIDLATLRSHIAVVPQEPLLFHGTIAENIAYGVPDATREEIVWAARAANAHDFIMHFADGYDTHIGERGLRLSGGQKQRISIARAILKNPRILILDEATSAVDTETERLIQEALDRLTANRTTIAIAHRLSTLQNADRLLVLDKGRIVEEGTHAELLAADGVFARLVRMQAAVAEQRLVV